MKVNWLLEFAKKISAVMIGLSIILSSTLFINFGEDIIAVAKMGEKSESKKTYKTEILKPQETVAKEVSSGENSSAATSSKKSNEKKQGKVISQFFTPYNANTSYNNTYMNNQCGININIKEMLNKKLNLGVEVNSDEPQVLILHTHATENYLTEDRDYYTNSDLKRTKDEKFSVVGVGERLKKELEEKGITTIHDKTLHDNPSYSGSYTRSSATMEKYLKKYPSIKLVIDLHRDAIADGKNIIRPVVEIEEKEAAQVMICVGSETGIAENFSHWKENLHIGLKLQQTLEVLYPGLARPLYLAYERVYNQDVSPNAIIIEFGTNGNTFAQAEYSAIMVADAIATMLKTAE